MALGPTAPTPNRMQVHSRFNSLDLRWQRRVHVRHCYPPRELANGEFETRFCNVCPIWRWPDIGGNALIELPRVGNNFRIDLLSHRLMNNCGGAGNAAAAVSGAPTDPACGARRTPATVGAAATTAVVAAVVAGSVSSSTSTAAATSPSPRPPGQRQSGGRSPAVACRVALRGAQPPRARPPLPRLPSLTPPLPSHPAPQLFSATVVLPSVLPPAPCPRGQPKMTAASGLGIPPPPAPAERQRQRCGGGHGGKCGRFQPPTFVAKCT